MRVVKIVLTVLLVYTCVGCNSQAEKEDVEKIVFERGTDILDPYKQALALGRGVNFGNLLDAYPQEGSFTNGLIIEKRHFRMAKNAGFESVRLPVKFSAHALDNSPYTLNENFMQRVDQVLEWGLTEKLKIVIVLHHYDELNLDFQKHRDRYLALWRQIASRYTNYPGELYYEILNEPNATLNVSTWNELLAECIDVIRKVDDYHTIVVDCVEWASISALSGLRIPDSEINAIATFHYYSPALFCLQGKQEWAGDNYALSGIVWPGPPSIMVTAHPNAEDWVIEWVEKYNTIMDPELNPASAALVKKEIAEALLWSKEHNRPLWMSEFCAQNGADIVSRVKWTTAVRTELENNNIPWSFWTLFSDTGSLLYDENSGEWVNELMEALGLTNPTL